MDTHNREGVLAMGNLLPNSLAVRHSRALRDLKQEHPCQVDLLIGKHNVEETLTAQKQAAGNKNQKNSEQNARYLLTIMTSRVL
jgi:hypothetical protein